MQFLPTDLNRIIAISEIIEITPYEGDRSVVRTRSNETHIVNKSFAALALDLTLEPATIIPAEPGYKVVEAICTDKDTNKWGYAEFPVIGWVSPTLCKGNFEVFECSPVVARGFFFSMVWGLEHPDGRVSTKNCTYYNDVDHWLSQIRKQGKEEAASK